MTSNFVTILALLLPVLLTTVTAANYCSESSCYGSPHIGCGNNGSFSAVCPVGQTVMVTMTESIKTLILNSHNQKRNTIAGGNLPGFEPAKRMATMRWNDELALLASYNVKTCTFAHDQCRNTNEFKWSGQNLAKYMWKGMNPTDEDIISGRIDSWWSEYSNADMTQTLSYPTTPPAQVIGHFTVMTAEKNIAVGCAAIKFPENGWSTLTLACNYAQTNILGYPLYRPGPKASLCTTGTNPNYSALCSLSEIYDVNVLLVFNH